MAEPADLTVSVPDLLMFAAVALSPVAAYLLTLIVPRLVETFRRRMRGPELFAPGPPIEQLAADLRRVHRLLRQLAPGTPIVRWRATRQAYDTLLVQACLALDVRHELDGLPEGFERNMERLRVEEALREAGLVVP